MIPVLLATALQAAAASTPDAGRSTLAEQMEALQGELGPILTTLEGISDELNEVEDGDTAGQAAAWARALTVQAEELSWFRVEDPLRLSAQLALEFAASDLAMESQPDGSSASVLIGYRFTGTPRTSDELDTAGDVLGDAWTNGFCADGEVETMEQTTAAGQPLLRERCQMISDDGGPTGVAAVRYSVGNQDSGSQVTVGVAASADSVDTRDALMGPAQRLADTMAESLVVADLPSNRLQD